MSEWIGRTISKVEIKEKLGRGGLAEVFLGHHTTLERPVAVKILHGYLSEDPSFLNRFRVEAQAVAAMRHANIVQVFDFDIVEGRPYIVMELLHGLPMDEYLEALHKNARKLPPETAARLIASIAAALDYAHAHGVVHRDIKPANVMLCRESGEIDPGEPLALDVDAFLTDFGIARILTSSKRTAPGSLTGTPAYISPEQAQGKPVDGRSDVYALGVILYEMLAGKLPFDAPQDNPFALIVKHISEKPPPVKHINPAVQAVLERAMAKEPEDRYQRAGTLAADLLVGMFGRETAQIESAGTYGKTPLLESLLDTLDLLVSQAKAYERALPPANFQARAAVNALSELARQALNEARDVAVSLEPLPPAPHPFSPRELEVLQLAAKGLTNKEIAYRLGISQRTVQFHMNAVFNKSATESRTEAVALALTNGWIQR